MIDTGTYIKEERGAIAGKMVVSAVFAGKTIYQRSVDLAQVEWARDLAEKKLLAAGKRAGNEERLSTAL